MAKTTVFGPEWQAQMQRAREAFDEAAQVDKRSRETMQHTANADATNRALDEMSQAATTAHTAWVEANPIRWARTHRNPPLSVPVLAPMVQLSTPSLFSWEHGGVSNPDPDAMKNIERALGESELGSLWREWRAIPINYGYGK